MNIKRRVCWTVVLICRESSCAFFYPHTIDIVGNEGRGWRTTWMHYSPWQLDRSILLFVSCRRLPHGKIHPRIQRGCLATVLAISCFPWLSCLLSLVSSYSCYLFYRISATLYISFFISFFFCPMLLFLYLFLRFIASQALWHAQPLDEINVASSINRISYCSREVKSSNNN